MNRQIILEKQPQGKILESDFKLIEGKKPEMQKDEVLGKILWLSMDPALFGRLRDDDNYAGRTNVGDIMQCYGIAQVVESKSKKFKIGDLFFANVGMQEFTSLPAKEIRKLNPYLGEVSWNLSVIGLAGVTAYFGLLEVGKPKKGETVVVSAAAGSVGSLVGQIAKIKGCKTIGIAGTDEKVDYLKNKLNFDEAINYKKEKDLSKAIKDVCPNGVDIYFDNVAGDFANSLLDSYNNFARIVLCGRMSLSNLDSAKQDVGMRDTTVLLRKRIRKQGFVVIDFEKRYIEAILMLLKWIKEGKIKIRENISEGLASAPKALTGLVDGTNTGKQLVKVSEINKKQLQASKFVANFLNSPFFPNAFVAKIVRWI
ncbi:MAG: NADP-dependent oxidoreductase [Bacteroidota bacterium]|nr:NADP-dependent oxidoreductase [Bacteroidota bacterium]